MFVYDGTCSRIYFLFKIRRQFCLLEKLIAEFCVFDGMICGFKLEIWKNGAKLLNNLLVYYTDMVDLMSHMAYLDLNITEKNIRNVSKCICSVICENKTVCYFNHALPLLYVALNVMKSVCVWK